MVEVHALRVAMEQSAAVTPRVQLTLARLNIEEQRIAQLVAQLDRAQQDLTRSQLETQKIADNLAEVDTRLLMESDEKIRKALGWEQADMAKRLKAQAAAEEQLRIRENEAAQALSTEQNRWVELNARLDELERLLAPVPR